MKTYSVGVREVYIHYVEVQAENEEEARIKAEELYETEEQPIGEYDYTLGWDHWDIQEEWFTS